MKKYVKPLVTVIEAEAENLLCGSVQGDGSITFDPEEETTIQKSPGYGNRSVWDGWDGEDAH